MSAGAEERLRGMLECVEQNGSHAYDILRTVTVVQRYPTYEIVNRGGDDDELDRVMQIKGDDVDHVSDDEQMEAKCVRCGYINQLEEVIW